MNRSLVLLAFVGVAFGKVDYSGHKVYRVFPSSIQNSLIKDFGKDNHLDFWSDYRFNGDFVDFRVPPESHHAIERMLLRHRILYEVIIEDLEFALMSQIPARKEQLSIDTFDYAVYHNYTEIDSWITNFASKHSDLASSMDVGTGKSLEGRRMRAIKISTGANKPAFVINCGIHAREWITPATCMYTANQLVSTYNVHPEVTELMNSVDFYLIPTSNPDGYNYTWAIDRMWRKTRSSPKSNNCSKCYGVDPNRNWDIHWNMTGGASVNCCDDDFRGPKAFSEVEIRNQRDFVHGIKNVRGYIDVHSYSQLWMYAYGWTKEQCPDAELLNKIGTESVANIKAVHDKTYVTGSIANTVYLSTGDTADYFYSQGIKCSFGAELRDKGKYGFVLPPDQIIPTGEEVFAGFLTIAKYIKEGEC